MQYNWLTNTEDGDKVLCGDEMSFGECIRHILLLPCHDQVFVVNNFSVLKWNAEVLENVFLTHRGITTVTRSVTIVGPNNLKLNVKSAGI